MASSSPEQMAQSMINNLPEKTGKSLAQWLTVLARQKPEKHGEIVKYLKSEHAVGHGFASLIAHEYLSAGSAPKCASDLVGQQYKGPKAELRPIYDALIAKVQKFGKDVEISPKKTYVSLRRNKQFGLIQASTKDRVDVGINLKGEPAGKRLEASGSFNAMVSHRVRVGKKSDVNAELIRWLKRAYEDA